ncbi:MAG: RluA family pseudouridine synthase [Holosporales bacterium]|jgi:23S rRNA pseudouridine1911/1915/1917 synthase|nr:RluA family pseudouridine synthase [Holosporales bacterium]
MKVAPTNNKANNKTILITKEFVGERIDIALAKTFLISRTRAQRLIAAGRVLLDGIPVIDGSKRVLKEGEAFVAECDDEVWLRGDLPTAQDIKLDIAYEDGDIIVLNKEAGMVCHPAPGNREGTLVNALLHHTSLSNVADDAARSGIVHRLDKGTSGLMVIAKTNESHNVLAGYFSDKSSELIIRKYKCFTFGTPPNTDGVIETFITRDRQNRQQYTTSADAGKYAITMYHTLKTKYITSTKTISLVECQLRTGRTHQIRVHMKHIDCPIIGDQVYKKNKIEKTYPDVVRDFARPALHSYLLEFVHPTSKERMKFETELPADMQELADLVVA